jgi:hypothetical protein
MDQLIHGVGTMLRFIPNADADKNSPGIKTIPLIMVIQ